jgi:hypothetical protein
MYTQSVTENFDVLKTTRNFRRTIQCTANIKGQNPTKHVRYTRTNVSKNQ